MNIENTVISAALAADRQASADPVAGVSVDPNVADFMGAFEEDALTIDDLDEVADGF
jgi:hypothetical protein